LRRFEGSHEFSFGIAVELHPRDKSDMERRPKEVTLQVTARRLNISQSIVRRMIEEKILPARQVVLCAPWQIPVGALESEAIRKEAANIKHRVRVRKLRVSKVSRQYFQTCLSWAIAYQPVVQFTD
jgi:hypothetical protein